MANSAAIIGAPTVSEVTEDTNLQTLIAAGMISISDANAGQAAFKTTVISASGNLGTLTIAANGAYSYKVADSAVQYLGAGDTKIDTFTVTSLDGTTKKIDFTIHGVNDAAIIGNVTASEVTEDKTKPNLTTSGKISISDVDQGEASFNTAVTSAAGNLGTLTLSSNGSYSYSVANSSVQYLGAGDTKIDTFTVTASDGTAKQLSFTIKGVNDAAVIGTPSVRDVTEDASNPSLIATGMISISDADQGEAAFKTTVISASGNLGTLTLAANGSYSYSVANNAAQYLGAGDTKTDTFTVTSLDGTTKQVSFTIHGKNDAAVIGTPTVHDVTEDATQPFLYALGTISISDADQGEAAFKTALISGPGTLGTLVLLSNGSYAYFVAGPAVQYLGANDTKVDTFTVTAADGTTQQVSFTIHGTNDVAVIGTPTVRDVTEDFSATTLTATGSISISDVDQGQAAFNTSVTSAGSNLGTLTLAANGTYSYSVANSATQFLGANDVKTDTFTIKSVDGTSQQVTFTIHGKNDAAVIGTPTVSEVTANPSAVTLTATGSISISDVDQGQASFKTNVTSAAGNFGQLALASNGTYSYTVAESVAAQLGTSGTKVDTFTITSLDGTTRQITFTVHGTGSGNHAAVIGVPTVSVVTEDVAVNGSGNLTAAGTISITDSDAGQAAFQTSVTSAGSNFGSLVLASNGSYTYTVANSLTQSLGAGATKLDTFTVTSLDGTSKQVTFTINGANDDAVISTPTVVDVTEDGNLSLSGTLTVTDVDQGQSSFQPTVTAVGTVLGSLSLAANGAYTYSVLNSATQSLGEGITKVDTFTIKSLDGTPQQVSFTIHGVSDAAVIGTAGIHDVTEDVDISSGNLTASGTFSIFDADAGQGSFQTTVTPVGANLGTLTLAANGAYTYSVANSVTQSMGAGVIKTDTFQISSLDGTTQQVSFTIHGANDAALIGTPAIVDVTEDVNVVGGNLSRSGTLSISDADTGQGSFQTTVTPVGTNLGTLTLAANGNYTYSVANSATQSLGATQTKTETFTVTSADNTSQQVSFVIHGTQDAPTLAVATASNSQNSTMALSISSALIDTSPTESLSLTITGVPAGAVLNNGSVDGNGVWHLTGSDLAGLTLTPAANDSSAISLSVTATSTDSANGNSQLSTTQAVAQTPILTATSSTIQANPNGASIPLGLHAALADLSETLGAVVITGVNGGYGLSAGVYNADGDYWLVPAALLDSLAMVWGGPAGTAASGSFALHVTARSIDGSSVATKSVDVTVNVAAPLNSHDGQAQDGYISGATVFADANGNGILDVGEASAITRADGTFTLIGGTGNLVMKGGTDVSTGLLFLGTLSAPNGSTVVTPLTTLVTTIATAATANLNPLAEGYAVAVQHAIGAAQDAIAHAFGLDTAIDLQNYDPVAAAAAGGLGAVEATKILAAGIQVQTTIAQITAAAGSTSTSADVVSAVAGAISDATGAVNLSDIDTLTSIILDAAPEASTAAIDAATSVVSAANTAIASAAAGTGGTFSVLTSLAQAATVALGQGADQLAAAAAGTGGATFAAAVTNNTGTHLTDAIAAAPVGDPDGSQVGTLGNDTISGAGGNDVIDGLDGNDTLSGLAGKDTIHGGNGNDKIFGGDGDDKLYGDDGRDVLTGGAGNDILDGGNLFDRASYTDATGGITVNLAGHTVSGAGVGTDTLISIEGIIGGDSADTFDATGYAEVSGVAGASIGQNEFEGKGGNDTIIGTLNGQGQKVTRANYLSATGAVTVDLVLKTADGDSSVGHDTLADVSGLWGSAYNDTFLGTDNAFGTYESYEGRGGDDFIDGRGGYDQVAYNNDTTTAGGIVVHLAAGTVTGDATVGTDTLRSVEAVRGTNFDDIYDATNFGGAGAVNVGSSGTFNDFGGAGGNDTVIGNGATRLNYALALASVNVDLETSAPGTTTAITVAGIATGATEGTDTLTGVNAVQGSIFSDTFFGSSFNNTFTGLGGDDYIDGRGGFDVASYNSLGLATGGVLVNLAAGTVIGDASIGTDTLRSIEGIQGTSFVDTFNATGYGNGQPTTLNVSNSNGSFNQFEGLGGDDLITGNGNTRIGYFNATAGVTVVFTGSGAGTADGNSTVGHDIFTGVNSVTGSAFADTIGGDGNSNTMTGGGGNDAIDGGGGADLALFTGVRSGYTISPNTPTTGQATVTDSVAGRDGTDTLTSIEVVQFSDSSVLIASGDANNPVDVSDNRLFFGGTANALTTLVGSTDNNFLKIGFSLSGHLINLGGGTDTVILGVTGGYNLNLANVENLTGTGGNDFVGMLATVNGLAIDLGAGTTDNVNLANGTNTVSVVNVENLNGSDFAVGSNSNDTLNLINNVSGLSVNLANGNNTLNLAAGANSFVNIGNVQHINGTASNDTLNISSGIFEPGNNPIIDLGAGDNTLNLSSGGGSLTLLNVQHLNGGSGDNFINLNNTVTSLAIDLGAGTGDSINLANGSNTVSVVNVENLNGSDFAIGSISNDTLNLTNNVSGLSVNLNNGNNTLNLAAGANSFVNISNVQHINGTGSNDTLNVSGGIFEPGNNTIVNLGAGDNSLNLGSGGANLTLLNVQHLSAGIGDNFINLNNTVTGLAVDLGAGTNDTLNLANGSNSISVINVEGIGSADWTGAASDDTLTLLNNVSGVSVTLQQGSNTLNLAAGANQFTNIWSVDLINGSASDDTLVIDNGPFGGPNTATMINLGAGDDTVTIGSQFANVGLQGVDHLNGNTQDNFFSLTNAVSGLAVDLGAGNDGLGIAAGASSLSVTGVENINTSDYSGPGGTAVSDDTLTLLNTVNGLTVNLQQGNNTLNLAAGVNSITAFNVQSINGTTSNDVLTMLNDAGGDTIDLGAGTDTLNLSMFTGGVTVKNIENVNGSADTDFITVANSTNPTTVTGGGSTDFITLSAGQDNLRYTNASQSAVGAGDVVTNFDASNDTFLLDHIAGGQVHFVSNGVFSGTPADHHSEARLNGNLLQIDLDGDGQIGAGDMEISLNNLNGTLSDANFVTTGVNHSPTDISLVGSSVAENSLAGTIVGVLSDADPDAGDTATFSIVNSNGAFAINGNNLVVAGAIDYEAAVSQQVTVRVTDSGGLSYDKPFNISVTDANDAPTVTSGTTGSVAENAATSTVVYQATAGDQDATAPNSTITWSLTGTDASAFNIDSNGAVRLNSSANFEVKNSYSLSVVATDGGNLSSSHPVTVSVTDVDEAPVITSGATASIAENAPTFTAVYFASAADPDAGHAPVTWSLTGADAVAFIIDPAGMVRLNNSADYEAKNSYSINVVATETDGGGLSSSKAVTVNVTDVNEAPAVTSGATATVAENAATSTVVYQAMASDQDTSAPNNTITWSLTGTDAAAFSVDAAGHVTLNSSANYEAKNSYSLNVTATDGGSLFNTKAVIVNVTNVNEAPTDISVSNSTIPQSTSSGTVIGALSAVDPDAGDTATFTLVGGAGGQFDVVGGNIVVGASPLATGAQQVTVRVTDSGNLTFDKTFTINVNAGALVVGDASANTLTGTSGDDIIRGLGGNDRLQGLAGNDMLDGGVAFDRAVYTDAAGGITVNLAAGTVSGAGVGNDTLIGIEGIVGSEFADNYDATGFAGNTFVAGTNIGLNEFEGRGGADTITSAVNSQGALLTRISYANAGASVTVDLTAHSASGGDGNDILVGAGFAGIVGSAFGDQLLGSSNAAGTVEVFEGRAGNDQIDGRGGFDRADYALDPAAVGGIVVNLAIGQVIGDAATVGTDTLLSVESVRGSNNNDTFDATGFGNGQPATINIGNNGTFNEFNGMGGTDNIIGNGNTRVTYINATGGVVVDLQTGATFGTGTADGDASTGHDTFSGVNAVQASMFNDTLRGSNSTATTETFYGGSGDDFIDGRGGFDIATYNNIYFSTGAITVNFAAGTVTGDASVGNDTLRQIEGVQGTNFNDVFVATNFGAAGFLNGSVNNVGNNGNFNQFEGIGGNDTITGNGNTRIIYSSATDAVTINLQAGTASGGASIGNDTFVGVNSATGSSLNDTYDATGFTGVTAAGSFGTFNLFEGLGGADTITGNGNTRVSYSQATGSGVNVNLGTGAVSGAGGADVITGGVNSVQGSNQSDTLTGATNDEFFFGGGGGDTINGNDGNDGITGQGGNDTIDGGNGTDMVSFTGAQGGGGYTINFDVPTAGKIQVVDNTASRDGTDTLSNVEVLAFSDVIMLLSSGTSGSPIDLSTQQQILFNGATITGTTGNDYLRIGSNTFGHQINLGAGTADTVILNSNSFGNGYTLNLVGVENLIGSSSDEFVGLTNNANGLVVDLGASTNDSLSLAAGANTLSMIGVEHVSATDYGATPGVNDVLTLQNNVSGVDISLGNGDNTMNLAAGANSFVNIFDINHVMGTTGDDTLTVTGAISAANGTTIDLGTGNDTLVLNGSFASFSAVGIEHIIGNASENSVHLTNNVTGIDINLGGGIVDGVSLASGINSLSITGVENLSTSDFGGLNPSNDTITLLNTVSGVIVNMGDGTANVLNLATGSNSLVGVYNVNLINGSASDDTLTLQGGPANVIDMGAGNDTVNFNTNVFDITVTNAETINGSANFDRITIGTNTAGNTTTITAGAGADEIFASAGHDNFRFASIADSAAGAADTIHNFDSANDSFTFSGIAVANGHIDYVSTGAFSGAGQASAYADDLGGGHQELHIDTDGNGTSDMDISLQGFTGTLTNSNFLLS